MKKLFSFLTILLYYSATYSSFASESSYISLSNTQVSETIQANDNCSLPQPEINDAGVLIKKKEVLIPDPYGKLNQAGVWSRIIVVKVELMKKGTGEKFTKKTVIGYLSPSTGSKLNEFNNNDLLFYQKIYGGFFSEYEYDKE